MALPETSGFTLTKLCQCVDDVNLIVLQLSLGFLFSSETLKSNTPHDFYLYIYFIHKF